MQESEDKEMKIITLKGESDVGKTSTIRMVYQALWQDEKNTERISLKQMVVTNVIL